MQKSSPNEMIRVDEAFEIIDNLPVADGNPTAVPVREALNNVLWEDVIAQTDSPHRDNTAMDGFVFRKQDLDSGQRRFPVAGDIRPEMEAVPALEPGKCARIVTGAPIPEGGDFVVPVELTRPARETRPAQETRPTDLSRMDYQSGLPDDAEIEVTEIPVKNPVRRRGEGFRRGDVLIPAGTVLRPYDLGLVIESGNAHCVIRKPLRVALQVSGSEITSGNNSNGPVLCAILSAWPGTDVTEWPVLADDPGAVRTRLRELKKTADVIVTTGGISAGAFDYLYDALLELGADCLIRKIRQKPGKPVTIFQWDGITVICLPGNPGSATATAELYARRIIRRLMELPSDPVFEAFLQHDLSNPGSRITFMPAALSANDGMLRAASQKSMRSHLMQQFRGSRVYLRLEPGAQWKAGDKVLCHAVSEEAISDGRVM